MNEIKTLTSTEEYLKRIEPYVMINNDLTDIENYVEALLNYLDSDRKEKYDFDEIIAYLRAVPELVEEIRKITEEMEMKIREYELQ